MEIKMYAFSLFSAPASCAILLWVAWSRRFLSRLSAPRWSPRLPPSTAAAARPLRPSARPHPPRPTGNTSPWKNGRHSVTSSASVRRHCSPAAGALRYGIRPPRPGDLLLPATFRLQSSPEKFHRVKRWGSERRTNRRAWTSRRCPAETNPTDGGLRREWDTAAGPEIYLKIKNLVWWMLPYVFTHSSTLSVRYDYKKRERMSRPRTLPLPDLRLKWPIQCAEEF